MNIDTMKALLLVAGKKDVRYYLNGVYIDHVKRLAVVTDGHTLIACKLDPDDFVNGSGIIPRELAEMAVKIKKSELVFDADGHIKLGGMDGKALDGKYPDWLRVIPETTSEEIGHFDPDLLQRVNHAGQLITGEKRFTMRLHMNGTGAAVAALGDKAIAVVMPMRESVAFSRDEPKWLADLQKYVRS